MAYSQKDHMPDVLCPVVLCLGSPAKSCRNLQIACARDVVVPSDRQSPKDVFDNVINFYMLALVKTVSLVPCNAGYVGRAPHAEIYRCGKCQGRRPQILFYGFDSPGNIHALRNIDTLRVSVPSVQ